MWCNDEYDKAINAALLTNDIDARKTYYQQANKLIATQLPLVPIAHAYRYRVHRDDVLGLSINPYGGIQFSEVKKTQQVQP
jgi:cationic peptide transport system substrate-binding protein